MKNNVLVIGAGLAGSEAAWQLVCRGIPVELVEMRPVKSSPAHHTEFFAELVCSNSLRAANVENAVGLLKEEMRRLGSLIMEAADATRVPAGGALAVDRVPFSQMVTERLKNHPLVTVRHEAAADAGVSLRQIEARQQSPDHPILWNVPETNYLKFYLFQVI